LDFDFSILRQPLSKTKALWPLFETIVNAIQSIEDLGNNNKIIEDAKKRNQILFDKLFRPKISKLK